MSKRLREFQRLSLDEQKHRLGRIRAGLVDPKPEHQELVDWFQEQEKGRSQLPGGRTRQELYAYQARQRAGMLDRPAKPKVPTFRQPWPQP